MNRSDSGIPSKFYGECTGTEIYLTEEEREQIKKSRENIAKGKTQRFKNTKEYFDSLDEDDKI